MLYRHDRGVSSLDTHTLAVVLLRLCIHVGDLTSVRDGLSEQNVPEDDDLEIPVPPPQATFGELIPTILAARLGNRLEVVWKRSCPSIHGAAN
jgi:hypothetical protein